MGWDAYSTAFNKKDENSLRALNMFRSKSTYISCVLNSSVDCFLHEGGLDLSGCRDVIQKYTEITCYEDLSPKQVREQYKEFPYDSDLKRIYKKEDLIYYYSAKYFLEICIKFNLGINFSY